ncbi:unnamed protein product, partial [Prorocentrum cordatum]
MAAPPAAAAGAGRSLVERLHGVFCGFQLQARAVQERTLASRAPLEAGLAEDLLGGYCETLARELRLARDDLRRDKWDVDEAVHAEHDTLCFCLAVLELVQVVATSSAPSAGRILHWYNRHYLEEELAEWWQGAQRWSEDPEARSRSDSEFWTSLVRLALSDRRDEVLSLLQRSAEASDPHVASFCSFLREHPSLQQMDQARASMAEWRQAVKDIREAARELLRRAPEAHPTVQLLRIYAGSSRDEFDQKKDVSFEHRRTWVEDVVYSHAWIFPDLRRADLSDLLQEVAFRQVDEEIDDVDRVFLAVLRLDVPDLLTLLGRMPERFPSFFVVHLVDVLYFANRVPLALEISGESRVPPRDVHLMAHSKELRRGPREHVRCAVDYLRSGSSEAAREALEETANEYCTNAPGDEDREAAITLVVELGLGERLGVSPCRRWAEDERKRGDVLGCLRWACRAEQCGGEPRGFFVSGLLDDIADEATGPERLAAALAPPGGAARDPPLERPGGQPLYPPEWLAGALRLPAGRLAELAPSGRLYFFVQLARCRARREAGRPPAEWAPQLVRLLSEGVAPPAGAREVVEGELLPVLMGDEPSLDASEALQLMRCVQGMLGDPLARVQMRVEPEKLHEAMGLCFSNAVLRDPRGLCSAAVSSGAPLPALGLTVARTLWRLCQLGPKGREDAK